MDMVGQDLTQGNELVAHPGWEGDIHQVITVDVPKLTLAQSIFYAPKAMGMRTDAFPFQEDTCYPLPCAINTHHCFNRVHRNYWIATSLSRVSCNSC